VSVLYPLLVPVESDSSCVLVIRFLFYPFIAATTSPGCPGCGSFVCHVTTKTMPVTLSVLSLVTMHTTDDAMRTTFPPAPFFSFIGLGGSLGCYIPYFLTCSKIYSPSLPTTSLKLTPRFIVFVFDGLVSFFKLPQTPFLFCDPARLVRQPHPNAPALVFSTLFFYSPCSLYRSSNPTTKTPF